MASLHFCFVPRRDKRRLRIHLSGLFRVVSFSAARRFLACFSLFPSPLPPILLLNGRALSSNILRTTLCTWLDKCGISACISLANKVAYYRLWNVCRSFLAAPSNSPR